MDTYCTSAHASAATDCCDKLRYCNQVLYNVLYQVLYNY